MISDRDYCVKLFATKSIKPTANKYVIECISALLVQMRKDVEIARFWTRAHTGADSPRCSDSISLS